MHDSLLNLFGNMNDPSAQKVLRSLDMINDVQVKAGEYVFKEGEKSGDFYVIGLGAVEVIKRINQSGYMKTLNTLGAGDFFGEGALFSGEPRSASIRALSDCRLFKIDKERFFKLLKNNNDVAVTFLSNMLAIVNQRLLHANKELIVLYEISRLISEKDGDLNELAKGVLNQLITLTDNEKGVFIMIDRVAKVETVLAQYGYEDSKINEISTTFKDFDFEETDFKASDLNYHINGKSLYLAIKDLNGDLNGVIMLFDKDGDFKNDEIRLCVSVVEQLGHVIQNFFAKNADEGREKLGQNYMSF